MTKRRQAKGYRMDQHQGHKPDPLVRMVATHPTQQFVVLGVGSSLRTLNCETGEQVDMNEEGGHQGAVRFINISPDGKHMLTGSDDKTSKLWSMESRSCLATWRMHKKLSAGTFTQDSAYALFADKFGDVAVAATGSSAAQPTPSTEPELLLGHLCSIVSSVAVSADNKYVATADRDGRVRISLLPPEPLKGAYEIQTYCMGHKNFVTSATFTGAASSSGSGDNASSSGGQELLVTGSGDGSVRVWEPESGALLSTYIAAPPRTATTGAEGAAAVGVAGQAGQTDGAQEGPAGEKGEASEGEGEEAQGEEEEAEAEQGVQEAGGGGGEDEGGNDRSDVPDCAALLCVAVSRDGRTLAVLVEGEQEVQILSLDPTTRALALAQRLTLPGVAYPCRADWDVLGRLWVVGGPPMDSSSSLHVAVLAMKDGQLTEVTNDVMSEETRGKLERRNAEEEAKLASGELDALLSQPMHRKKYENQDAWSRKRPRNDHKENLRLAQLRAKAQAPAQ